MSCAPRTVCCQNLQTWVAWLQLTPKRSVSIISTLELFWQKILNKANFHACIHVDCIQVHPICWLHTDPKLWVYLTGAPRADKSAQKPTLLYLSKHHWYQLWCCEAQKSVKTCSILHSGQLNPACRACVQLNIFVAWKLALSATGVHCGNGVRKFWFTKDAD